MNYLKLIQNGYQEWLRDSCREYDTKFNFLADGIFEIFTYENVYSAKMAEEFLEVCVAISDRKTFDMISTPEGNALYLRTTQYDFFQSKIEWGCSIRGAWWNWNIKLDSCYLVDDDGNQVLALNLEQTTSTEGGMQDFVRAMVDFVNEED